MSIQKIEEKENYKNVIYVNWKKLLLLPITGYHALKKRSPERTI